MNASTSKGQAFLSLIFLIGVVVVGIGVAVAFLASSFVDTGYGYQASIQADAVATSGAQDALLQLDRNVGFSSGGYSVAVGSSTATVTVTPSSTVGFTTIISSATVSNHTRKVNVVVSVVSSTSQVSIVSWQAVQ
jgi:hypothetical protein